MAEVMASASLYERVDRAARAISARLTEIPRIAIVLGSGLGDFGNDFKDAVTIPYQEIPGFPSSTVAGHAGRLVLGLIEGVPVLVMQGRVHFYEGYSLAEVTFPVRTFKLLGIKTLVLTNAAGGVDVQLSQGALMLISDHLNLMGANPLCGPNDERFGPRFPDMTDVYSRELQQLAVEEARGLGVELRRGIYAALSGPSYETPAEIHMLRGFGADAVGMSTVPEAIVARQMGLEVLGISCITNMAAGLGNQPINHEEVVETGKHVRQTFARLLRRLVVRLGDRHLD